MKTSITASAALFFVLALALLVVTAPLIAEAKKEKKEAAAAAAVAADDEKKIQDDFCVTLCEGRKDPDLTVCRESCVLSQRSNMLSIERITCQGKCVEQKGTPPPAIKACEEACDKEYKPKAAEVAAACVKACSNEKQELLNESCRMSCTPPV